MSHLCLKTKGQEFRKPENFSHCFTQLRHLNTLEFSEWNKKEKTGTNTLIKGTSKKVTIKLSIKSI